MQKGRCYCGTVRFELDAEVGVLVNCHCPDCRRAHGAAFATTTMVPRAALRFTAGEEAVREYEGGTGSRFYCERCAGRLFNHAPSIGESIMLVVATLDPGPEGRPMVHVNVEDMAEFMAGKVPTRVTPVRERKAPSLRSSRR